MTRLKVRRANRFTRCLVLGIPLFWGLSAQAQPKDKTPQNSGKSHTPAPKPGGTGAKSGGGAAGGIALADEEFRLDSVGLAMRIPALSQAESVRIGDKVSVQISPADAKWVINIQTPVTSNEKATIQEAADKTIEVLQASVGILEATKDKVGYTDTQAKVLDRVDDLLIKDAHAARFYVSLPSDNDPRGRSRLVKGYTIFKPFAKQYVVFELICAETDFSSARLAYETSVGTASFESGDAINAARRAVISAGLELFRQFSEQDYLSAMGGERGKEIWYRLYMPAANGAPMDATELGYRGLKFWKGQRGEVDPKKPRGAWVQADKQEGYLAQDRSRVLVNGMIADTLTIYFMTPNRAEETWSATTAVKDQSGKSIGAVTETGSRLGNDLTVVTSESGKPVKTTKPVIGGEGYISQFEKALLPRLLASKRMPAEYGFYAWDTLSAAVVFRRDTLEKQRVNTRDAKIWHVTTTIRDDSKKQVTTVTDNGEVMGATLEDGRTWEQIELGALKSLWQQKGLPTDR